jgi:hypothetical protein
VRAEYEPYEDPAPISWKDPHGLRELYRNLATLRENLPAIHSGSFIPLRLQGSPAVFGFLRSLDRENWALVLLNFGPAAEVSATLPAEFVSRLSGPLQDALSGRATALQVDPAGVMETDLDPFEPLVLIPSRPPLPHPPSQPLSSP